MISVIRFVASFVCSDNWRISSATTANPFPASPALAASIEAFNARRLVWLEILKIVATIPFTSSTRLLTCLVDSAAWLLACSTLSAWFFNPVTSLAPSATFSIVWFALSIIASVSFSALSVFLWISSHINACCWIASAVLPVLWAILEIDSLLLLMTSSNVSNFSFAESKCFTRFSAVASIFSDAAACISRFSSLNFVRRIDASYTA